MVKKILAAMVALSVAFTPVGSYVFDGHDNTVSAKSYKSGKRSFNVNPSSPSRSNKQQSNFFNNKKSNNSFTNSVKKRGGFMRGLLFGGIAGMLMGGLLGNMGGFGAFLGLLINVIAVIVVISLIRSIFRMLKNRRREQEDTRWKR
jgi:predicted lipid-binding transport protein (Tim44 family)